MENKNDIKIQKMETKRYKGEGIIYVDLTFDDDVNFKKGDIISMLFNKGKVKRVKKVEKVEIEELEDKKS